MANRELQVLGQETVIDCGRNWAVRSFGRDDRFPGPLTYPSNETRLPETRRSIPILQISALRCLTCRNQIPSRGAVSRSPCGRPGQRVDLPSRANPDLDSDAACD